MGNASGQTRFPPTFADATEILHYEGLRYNPCDDLIFPSVINAEICLTNPLGRYYMYYAPHNAPGGMCLAYADRLEGPWTEYPGNPLIGNVWPPHYEVRHVSSPHALYVPEASRLFLYYHGDNDTTRFATSGDGLHFDYGGVAVSKDSFPDISGTSYARVFRHEAGTRPENYLMLVHVFKVDREAAYPFERLGLNAAWSLDGRTWVPDPEPIVSLADLGENEFLCAPSLLHWGDRNFVLFHRDRGDPDAPGEVWTEVYSVEVDAGLNRLGDPALFCSRRIFGDDNPRWSDPNPIIEGDTLYLFGSIGPRLHQRIGLAKARIGTRG